MCDFKTYSTDNSKTQHSCHINTDTQTTGILHRSQEQIEILNKWPKRRREKRQANLVNGSEETEYSYIAY